MREVHDALQDCVTPGRNESFVDFSNKHAFVTEVTGNSDYDPGDQNEVESEYSYWKTRCSGMGATARQC